MPGRFFFVVRGPVPRDRHRYLNALRGTGPRATGTGCRFFVVRGPSRLYQRDAGFPASPTLPPRSLALREGQNTIHPTVVRGPVPRDLSLILAILIILAILLQTERVRGTGPRATVGWRRALRGTGPRPTGAGGLGFFRSAGACPPRSLALREGQNTIHPTVVRGPVPRDLSLILAILIILAILLQTRETLRSSRTFSACCADASIDIKVFQTFFSLILTNPGKSQKSSRIIFLFDKK